MAKYVIRPNLRFYSTYIVTGNQEEELVNDIKEDEEGTKLEIVQTIKGLEITTRTKVHYVMKSRDIEIDEENISVMKVKENQMLAYVDTKGYVIPEHQLCTVEEAIEDLKVLEG